MTEELDWEELHARVIVKLSQMVEERDKWEGLALDLAAKRAEALDERDEARILAEGFAVELVTAKQMLSRAMLGLLANPRRARSYGRRASARDGGFVSDESRDSLTGQRYRKERDEAREATKEADRKHMSVLRGVLRDLDEVKAERNELEANLIEWDARLEASLAENAELKSHIGGEFLEASKEKALTDARVECDRLRIALEAILDVSRDRERFVLLGPRGWSIAERIAKDALEGS